MTRSERVRLFRPARIMARMDRIEAAFLRIANRAALGHYEDLRLQLAMGARPRALTLNPKRVIATREALVKAMMDSSVTSRMSARTEIARALRAERPRFAVDPKPDPDDDPMNYLPDEGLAWYRDYALRLVGVVDSDALERAKEIVIAGIESGLPHRQMMRELQEVFTSFRRHRLENIARTEVAKIYSQSRWREFDSTEEIVGYEVAAIKDLRTTDICRARDGKRFPKDQIEGNLPPYHFSCRTVLLPIFAWEAEEEGFEWKPIARTAPRVLRGFGTTKMEIPPRRKRR